MQATRGLLSERGLFFGKPAAEVRKAKNIRQNKGYQHFGNLVVTRAYGDDENG